jgi:hypothetical protein
VNMWSARTCCGSEPMLKCLSTQEGIIHR